jgi:hypothetical protein
MESSVDLLRFLMGLFSGTITSFCPNPHTFYLLLLLFPLNLFFFWPLCADEIRDSRASFRWKLNPSKMSFCYQNILVTCSIRN